MYKRQPYHLTRTVRLLYILYSTRLLDKSSFKHIFRNVLCSKVEGFCNYCIFKITTYKSYKQKMKHFLMFIRHFSFGFRSKNTSQSLTPYIRNTLYACVLVRAHTHTRVNAFRVNIYCSIGFGAQLTAFHSLIGEYF